MAGAADRRLAALMLRLTCDPEQAGQTPPPPGGGVGGDAGVRGELRLPSSLSGTPGIPPHCFSESHFTRGLRDFTSA